MSSQTLSTRRRIDRGVSTALAGGLLCAAAGVVGAASAVAAPQPTVPITVTFTAPGESAFRVPPGVTTVHVVVIGGHGGRSLLGLGGSGARVEADLAVRPEEVLYAEVAADGGDPALSILQPGDPISLNEDGRGGAGGAGFGSGGPGSFGRVSEPGSGTVFAVGGGGGGGASAIVDCPLSETSCAPVPQVVAGGGGGGGYNFAGGDGGTRDGATGGGTSTLLTPGTITVIGGEGGRQDRFGVCAAANVPGFYCIAPTAPGDGTNGFGELGSAPFALVGAGGGGGGYFGGGGGFGTDRGSSDQPLAGGGGGGGSSLVPTGGRVTAGQPAGAALVSFTYTAPDTTEPTVTTPAGLTVEATGPDGAAVPFVATATDADTTELPISCDHAPGSTFPLGATDVTCSATGTNGVQGRRTFRVTVQDTTPPVVAGHDDVTAQSLGGSIAVDYQPPTATDAVDGDRPVTCVPAPGSVFQAGTTPVSCDATDAAGNTGRVAFSVLVTDRRPPQVSTPGDLTAEATSGAGAAVPFAATALDSDGAAAPVTCDHLSGTTFPVGATTVTCRATGGNGVAGEGRFTITVRDTAPPVIAPHADVDIVRGGPTRVDYAAPGASDAVDGPVPVSCLPATGTTFPLGATPVTCRATDAAGNVATARFTVRVTAPQVQAPAAPGIGTARPGNGAATVAFTPPSVTGGAPVTGYLVTAAPGGRTATGTTSPITVTGLSNGTSYRFTVQAINSAGTGAASARSNAVIPVPPPARADVRVWVSGPTSVRSGGVATYTLTVTNAGPGTAAGLVAALDTTGLSHTSSGAVPASASTGASQFAPGDYRWTLGPLAAGASVTLRVTGTVSARAGQPAGARGGAVSVTADPDLRNNVGATATRVTVQ